jgi:hypothetical protein
MCADLLTRDNLLLSRTKTGEFSAISETSNDGDSPIDEHVASLVRESLAENTRRAYLSDLAHFESRGGMIPATEPCRPLDIENFDLTAACRKPIGRSARRSQMMPW